MERKPEDTAIIERIEQVRKGLEMNKSKFIAGAGFSPQTYGNFVGAQGSKPSLALVVGVAAAYAPPGERAAFMDWLVHGDDDNAPAARAVSPLDRIGVLEADVATLKDGLLTHCHDMDDSVGGGDTTSAMFLNPDDRPRIGDTAHWPAGWPGAPVEEAKAVACIRCDAFPVVVADNGRHIISCDACYDGAPDSGTRHEVAADVTRAGATALWNDMMDGSSA